jgi:tetratricopeptide (TPR) repeat protein
MSSGAAESAGSSHVVPEDPRAAVADRLRRVAEEGNPAAALELEALEEARRLGETIQSVQDDAGGEIGGLLGMLHWQRSLALAEGDGGEWADRELAYALFSNALMMGLGADRIPGPLLERVVNDAAQAATPLLPGNDGDGGQTGIETLDHAVRVWRRILVACPAGHPNRASMLTNLGVVLRTRAEQAQSVPDSDEAVSCFRSAVEATPEGSDRLSSRLLNLGIAVIGQFARTEADEDLAEAVSCYQRALDAMGPDDPERSTAHWYLGAAYRIAAQRKTFSFEQAAFVEKHLLDLHEAVYAVCAFLVAPNQDAMVKVVRESPQLRGPSALAVLDRLIEDAEALGDDAWFPLQGLTARRALVEKLQTPAEAEPGGPDDGRATAGVGAGQDWADQVATLLAEGRIEQAEAVLARAVARAREAADPAGEARAEYALHELVFTTVWPAAGSVQRMAGHAERAASAFGRARDRRGLASALGRRVSAALELEDTSMWEDAWMRLVALSPAIGVWWNTYLSAAVSEDPEYSRAQLEWCLERVERLGPDAAHYRAVCESKIAFLDGRAAFDGSGLAPEFGALMQSIEHTGATAQNGARLETALRPVEMMRSFAHSQANQRALSEVYEPVYAMLSRCTADSDVEQSLDALERNTSRSILAHMAADLRSAEPATPPRERRSLDELLLHFLRLPTPQRRHLLTVGFESAREADRHAERRKLAAVRGPGKVPGSVAVSGLRDLLADDAVLFFGGTGMIYLITSRECRIVGSFTPDTPHLDADALTSALNEHVARDARIFLVPYGAMWRSPTLMLGSRNLADAYRVAAVPSLSVLAALLRAGPHQNRPRRFAGLANPDGSLPHAQAEVDAAAAHYPDPMIRTGSEAGRAAYEAAAAEADIVHLACHGFYLAGYPDFTGLYLSSDSGRSGLLWYSDLAEIRLGASLVVLAACHAGTGEALPGSEYVGIPGALLVAGAKTVLAPVHAVDDEATALFMQDFYDAYAESASPALALRYAKQAAAGGWHTSATAFHLFGMP